jgi:hypothetical protein
MKRNKYIDINLDLLASDMFKLFGDDQISSLSKLSDEELSTRVKG